MKLSSILILVLLSCFLFSCGDATQGNTQQGKFDLTLNGESVNEIVAVTPDGQRVKLFNDGTWQFFGEDVNSSPSESEEPQLTPEEEVQEGLTFELVDKSYQSPFDAGIGSAENLKEYNIYEFKITNPTQHSVKAVKGEIIITDIFDEELSTFTFNLVEDIPAEETIDWGVKVETDRFSKNRQVQGKKLEDLKAQVRIKKVLLN